MAKRCHTSRTLRDQQRVVRARGCIGMCETANVVMTPVVAAHTTTLPTATCTVSDVSSTAGLASQVQAVTEVPLPPPHYISSMLAMAVIAVTPPAVTVTRSTMLDGEHVSPSYRWLCLTIALRVPAKSITRVASRSMTTASSLVPVPVHWQMQWCPRASHGTMQLNPRVRLKR